jgi:predicted Zn-dependent protease
MKRWWTLGKSHRRTAWTRPKTRASLRCEPLEPRTLLYNLTGYSWPHPERITVSFVPDGTWEPEDYLNARQSDLWASISPYYDVALWKREALRGLQEWAMYANLNFVLVSDDGSRLGSAGSTADHNYQGDIDFGDIRIGGWRWGEGVYAMGGLPHPYSTESGDIQLNTYYAPPTSDRFDPTSPGNSPLEDLMLHEAGHALGLDHSYDSEVMAPYSGMATSLGPDDIAGIQALYGARQHDVYDQTGRGTSISNPIVLTDKLDSLYRVTINNLDITTVNDQEWFRIKIPSGAGPYLTIRMYVHGLSLLRPRMVLYDSQGRGLTAVNGAWGQTVTIRWSVSPGQVYSIMTAGLYGDEFSIGRYAFQLRISENPFIPPEIPNTATPVEYLENWRWYVGKKELTAYPAHDHSHAISSAEASLIFDHEPVGPTVVEPLSGKSDEDAMADVVAATVDDSVRSTTEPVDRPVLSLALALYLEELEADTFSRPEANLLSSWEDLLEPLLQTPQHDNNRVDQLVEMLLN